jgi:hypothetical protein
MTRTIVTSVLFATLVTAAHAQVMPSPIGPPMPRAEGPSYVVVLRSGSGAAPRVAAQQPNTPAPEAMTTAAVPEAVEQIPAATPKSEAKPAAKPAAKTASAPHSPQATRPQAQARPANVAPQTRPPAPPRLQQAGPPPRRLHYQQQAR